MKLLFITLLFIFTSAPVFLQNGIFWSDPIPVAEPTFGNSSPRIALLDNGSPVVLWGKSGKIYFSKMVDNEFTEPLQINTNGVTPGIYNFGGLDLATFGDNVYVVFEKFTSGIYVVRSEDGGETFELPVHAFAVPSGEGTTLPAITIDNAGNPIANVIRANNNETHARHITVRSNDGGLTFEPPVVASEPANGDFVCECCPADLHTTDENVWLVFRNNDNNKRDMWVSKSEDNATTFTSAVDVDATDWQVNFCPASAPQISSLSGDSLITVWMSGASGPDRVYFSTMHGGTMEKGWEYSFPQLNGGDQRRPDVAGQNDTLGVVWEETGFGTNATDLMFAFSKTGSTGLPTNFENITNASGNQRFPSVVYANGAFHLIYVNGSSSVMYRRGVVSEVDGVREVVERRLLLRLTTNPVSGNIISLINDDMPLKDVELRLSNLAGQIVHFEAIDNFLSGEKISVNRKNLPAGNYILYIQSSGGFWSEKIQLN